MLQMLGSSVLRCAFIVQLRFGTDGQPISRRVDLRLLPLCSIIYALALIDRTNLGIARAAGLARDLVSLPSLSVPIVCIDRDLSRNWT